MSILVDSSVWVAYFRGSDSFDELEYLLDEDLLVTNELILAELVPALLVRGESAAAESLRQILVVPLAIDWENIVEMQTTCLRHGANKVGIPDLIIAQHALQQNLRVYSLDRHFRLLGELFPLVLWA